MDNEKARSGGVLVRNKKEQLARARKIRGRLKTSSFNLKLLK